MGPGAFAAPATQYKTTRKIPPQQVGNFKYVKISVSGSVTLEGTLTPAMTNGITAAAVNSDGRMKAEMEAKVENELGSIKVTGAAEPGKPGEIGIEFGKKFAEFDLSFGVNADLDNIFEFGANIPKKVTFDLGSVTFEGKIAFGIKIHVSPTPEGWAALGRGAATVGRVASGIARGLAFTGEAATVSTGAAVGVGVGVGLVGFAWTGFALYMIGKAGQDGRTLAVRYTFATGYRDMLVWLTNAGTYFSDGKIKVDHLGSARAHFLKLVNMDWRAVLEEQGKKYIRDKDRSAFGKIKEAGAAAMLQTVDQYMRRNGLKAWQGVVQRQRKRYGESTLARQEAYKAILYRQAREGAVKGIALER